MKYLFAFLFLSLCLITEVIAKKPLVLVIHGGAGYIPNLTPTMAAEYKQALSKALNAGYQVLEGGGNSVDAVRTAITSMENSGQFNAGKGARPTSNGDVSLDASIMSGRDLKTGAIVTATNLKNPIQVAYTLMNEASEVLITGTAVNRFAKKHNLPIESRQYFKINQTQQRGDPDDKHGTVGAVALDKNGNLAAGTSTGGIGAATGRVGDSGIIGAGTYANASCAVSSTGIGEYFIRTVAAYRTCAQYELQKNSVKQAGESTLALIKKLGGHGGQIILDKNGHVATLFNSGVMLIGINFNGKASTTILEARNGPYRAPHPFR